MIDFLDALLKEKCDNENCKELYIKWSFDRERIPNILSNVSRVFPHFTDHGVSHSNGILSYIVRILGKDKIKSKFSATDLWLLLSSAYYHDIGMVIFKSDLKPLFENSDFRDYIKMNQENPSSSIHEQAKFFRIKGNQIEFEKNIFDENSLNSITNIFSEFFRSKHAKRSYDFILEYYLCPKESLMDITSVIPARLFRVLGKICCAHGSDFKDVLKNIPEEELGVGSGCSCHPRLLACLLRIGDLLDLDNNRINQSSIDSYGEDDLPDISKWHLYKHKSIDHYVVNTKLIEINAVVSSNNKSKINDSFINEHAYNISDTIQSWFNWIKNEFKNQKLHWNSISPVEYGLTLPDIGEVKVEFSNGYENLEEDKKPKFVIGSNQAFELVQGMNLYNNSLTALREIIQNAVDSTYIKYWCDYKAEYPNIEKNERGDYLFDFFSNNIQLSNNKINLKSLYDAKYKIDIYLEVDEKDIHKTQITIKDHAMGLTKNDLTYLLKVGSGKENDAKRKLVEDMPHWFKPSGAFGIGFQSIFLLTDVVFLKTKSHSTGERYNVTMYSPSKRKRGDVLIHRVSQDAQSSFTEIKFSVENAKFENKLHLGNSEFKTNDIFADKSQSLFHNMIISSIKNYSEYFPFLINIYTSNRQEKSSKLKVELKKFGSPILKIKKEELNIHDFDDIFMNEELNTQISIDFTKEVQEYSGFTRIFFKNQFVCDTTRLMSFPYVNVSLNILSEDSKEWLRLDRSRLKEDKEPYIDVIIRASLAEYFKESSSIKEVNDDNCVAKISLIDHIFLCNKKYLNNHKTAKWLEDKWKGLIIKEFEHKKIDEILNCSNVIISDSSEVQGKDFSYDVDSSKKEITIVESGNSDLYNLKIMLVTLLKDEKKKINYTCKDRNFVIDNSSNNDSLFSLNFGSISCGVSKDMKCIYYLTFLRDLIKKHINKFRSKNESTTYSYDRNYSINNISRVEWIKTYLTGNNDLKEKRGLIPCIEGYEELAIDTMKIVDGVEQFLPFDLDKQCNNLMISPFCFNKPLSKEKNQSKVSSALINFVANNLCNKKDNGKKALSEDEIRSKYEQYINMFSEKKE